VALAERTQANGGGGEVALTAADVARLVNGVVAPNDDAERVVRRIAPLDRAGPEELTFYASPRYAEAFARCGAGAVLVAPELAEAPGAPGATRIVVAKPHEALLAVIPALYQPPPRTPGIHHTAILGRGVRLGVDVSVGPYVVLGDGAALDDRVTVDAHCVVGAGVALGTDSHLYPGVTLYPGTTVGKRVTLHSGVRLGSDGFGYVYADGAHQKIPHVGRCIIGDDVEIGANTTIDRGSVDDTVIGAGTKIDNLVHLGHNVRVGRLCLIMAQVGVAGSSTIEDGAILAGQVGVGGHMTVGRGARVGGQGGVTADVPAGATYSGYPARPHKESLRASAALFKLPSMMRGLEALLAERAKGEDA
jgi:UDP-3-O-[3-hydroxymyristoyl] glucosamine N-acyltransferase